MMIKSDVNIFNMSKNIKKNLFLEEDELGTIKEQTLGSKRVNLSKPEVINHHHQSLLFVLTHLFRCCGCCPCKLCRNNEKNSNIINNNLSSSSEVMCLIPSSFTITSGNLLHISSRLSDLSPTNSVLSNDDKRLHKLSAAFFKATENGFGQSNLMNDWEIVGTQNRWVCPNDRHLQLRAQLKSGWCVRTANVRSATNAKKNVITDSEKKHITAVLAKAEDRRLREKQRIGRMIDRLEKLKSRATGNGITQCYLCSTDFGLLSSRSYAAMCSECRKYVCQKNCGVEAYDFVRRENIFLCKICSEYREVMWKKSGAWFYNEIPEYIKPDENSESHSPSSYYPRNSWQHYTKSETSNLAYSSNKSQQSQKEQCNPVVCQYGRINPSWLHQKVRLSLSNGYTSEDENADNSASDDMEILSKKNLQLTSSIAATNRRNRIQKRIEEQDIPIIHRFTIGTRNRTTNNEDNESHHATSSTSPRHSASLYGDDLSQNQSSILASESIDSGVVPSDHSIRISNIPASADAMNPSLTMIAHVDESNKFLNYSNYPQTLKASTRIQKTILSSEIPSLQSHDGKSSLSMQQESKNSKEISENNDILLEKIFPLMILANEQSSSVAFPQYNQEEQLLTFSPSYTASPSSPVGTIITPTDSSKKQAPNHESTVSSASSTSSIRKSMVSLESLPANLEKLKVKETSTFGKFTLDGRRKVQISQKKSNASMQSPKKGLSSTQSAICLQSSIATESFPTDQSVRHAISGNDINNLQNFDIDKCGSIQFTLRYSAQQMKLHIRLTSAKNLRAMDKNGFSDPFVKLYLIPGASKATKMVSKTIEKTLNPLWNEEFTYYGVTDEDQLKKSLRLLVLDRDRIGSDFLGEVHVPLKDLKNDEETFYNLHLKQAILAKDINPSNERGKICLSLLYNVQQGSLYVTIKRCAELLGMDKTGFSDPYVKVSLLPLTNKAHRKKTSTKKRTLNPEFNETLTFVIPFKDLPKKTLQLDVFDKDVGKHDDYIGSIILSTSAKPERQKQWNNCIQNPGYEFEQWHKLEVIE